MEIWEVPRLEEVLREVGVRVPWGKVRFMARCPLHDDHTPSMSVDLGKQVWYCFACCIGGGPGQLLKRLGRDVVRGRRPGPGQPREVVAIRKESRWVVPEAILESMRAEREAGLAYLAKRGLSREVCERWDVMFWGLRTSELADKMKLEDTPLGRKSEPGWALEGYVVVPLVGLDGKVRQLYGRSTLDWLEQKHRYLRGSRGEVLPVTWKDATIGTDVVVAESVIDAMSLYELGVKNVVPIYGVSGWKHLLALRPGHRFILALDTDKAGEDATSLICKELERLNIKCRPFDIDLYIKAKDWNEYLLQARNSKSFGAAELRAALRII